FFIRDLVMMIFVAALGAAIRISMRWRFLKEQLVESEKQKTDAELKNLKNQLNPHFLLNTLNNIYALVEFNQEKAQEAIQELSKLLRYMLYEDQTSLVPLAKEYDFIRNYVELMKIRLPEHVSVQMNLTEEPQSNVVIAPFIFISLIENAFKHGVSPSENSFINISIIGKYNGNVVCEILNSNFPKSSEDKSGHGIGLEQVQKRLELIYPNHYEWTNDKDSKNVYHSILTIQTR
ncbi:MAG: sensor histidine kinase, partial [Phocaeicola sp.]|nr:sensor histidine kinase [Phocaeicola sp.]